MSLKVSNSLQYHLIHTSNPKKKHTLIRAQNYRSREASGYKE